MDSVWDRELLKVIDGGDVVSGLTVQMNSVHTLVSVGQKWEVHKEY